MTLKRGRRQNRIVNEAESNIEHTCCFRSDTPNFSPYAIALPPAGRGKGKHMTEPVLSVRNLQVEFATRRHILRAIDGVSFDIAKGEVLGVVGESGAGKSVTGLAVIGLLDPPGRISGGEIRLSGLRIDHLPPEDIRRIRGKRIGMIFQDPLTSLNPLYKIGDQIVETIKTHTSLSDSAARKRAIDLLAEVGIPAPDKRIDGYPHEFSGGMRQRVVIALAICAEPELIIADEPTTALDVSVQAQIITLIKRLGRDHGTAVMLVTHDMGVIAETCDRVAVMYSGRVAEIGPVGDVVRNPLHPYAKGLMGAIPTLAGDDKRLVQIPGAMPRLSAIPPGCSFNPRCAFAFDRCRVDRPEPIRQGAQAVACHLFDASVKDSAA
jgi:peptide/nickel transport system ATP-binding protein